MVDRPIVAATKMPAHRYVLEYNRQASVASVVSQLGELSRDDGVDGYRNVDQHTPYYHGNAKPAPKTSRKSISESFLWKETVEKLPFCRCVQVHGRKRSESYTGLLNAMGSNWFHPKV